MSPTRLTTRRRLRLAVCEQIVVASAISALALMASLGPARAQGTQLPPVPINPPAAKAPAAAKPATQAPAKQPQPTDTQTPATAEAGNANAPLGDTTLGRAGADIASMGAGGRSLTVPTTEQARALIERTPGGVTLVSAAAYRDTQATTIKDVLDFVPGVWVQPKWGEDSRISIRGSSLSRNFHLRSIQLYLDGIPINTADGYGDFQEIDPSAYRYVEVYKGGNALRFGANSLGGAINFVTPSGRDASIAQGRMDFGSFGFKRLQASSGAASGAVDAFVTGSWQEQGGFRDHSNGEALRGSANVGFQLNSDTETRFYINANQVRQRLPGSVTRDTALTSPQTPAGINVINDWQRNIDTVRYANRTMVRLAPTTALEVGVFGVDRHLMHPIFEWLDSRYTDYGTFARLIDERRIGEFKNRFLFGVNLHNGEADNEQYVNNGAQKGALTFKSNDTSKNLSAYTENQFFFLPDVAAVAGVQFLHATRNRKDLFLANGDQSGQTEFNLWSPKAGLIWDVTRDWQLFANVSRSAEVPSYGENVSAPAFLGLPNIPFTSIRAQTATTYEAGTRGRRPDTTWDLVAYRSEIKNELMCYYNAFVNCNVTNADRTVHQGLEIGFGFAVAKGLIEPVGRPDRLWLNTAYTYSDFHFVQDATFANNAVPGAPRHYLRGELLYKHPGGIFFGPNIEWVPEAYFVDSANTLKTEKYTIWGAKLGWDDGRHWSAFIEGRNLSDEKYIASASVIDRANPTMPLFEPGTGRAVYGGFAYRW